MCHGLIPLLRCLLLVRKCSAKSDVYLSVGRCVRGRGNAQTCSKRVSGNVLHRRYAQAHHLPYIVETFVTSRLSPSRIIMKGLPCRPGLFPRVITGRRRSPSHCSSTSIFSQERRFWMWLQGMEFLPSILPSR